MKNSLLSIIFCCLLPVAAFFAYQGVIKPTVEQEIALQPTTQDIAEKTLESLLQPEPKPMEQATPAKTLDQPIAQPIPQTNLNDPKKEVLSPEAKLDPKAFMLGFTSIPKETQAEKLLLQGKVPSWLRGYFLGTGPGKFEINNDPACRWMDGFAMLHRININDEGIHYTNKILESVHYKKGIQQGKMPSTSVGEQANSVFSAFSSFFSAPKKDFYDNGNSNVFMIGNHYVASTETPSAHIFDPVSLTTISGITYDDNLMAHYTCCHPHYDEKKEEWINYCIEYGYSSTYKIYRIKKGSTKREVFSKISVSYPSYMHSFSVTDNYIILAEYPFKLNPLDLLSKGKPFIENFLWKPKKETVFHVINRTTGKVEGKFNTRAFFSLDHINAYEEQDKIIIDIATYENPNILFSFDLKNLQRVEGAATFPQAKSERFTLNMKQKTIDSALLFEKTIFMPTVNPTLARNNYTYLYATTSTLGTNFPDSLIKIDVTAQKHLMWSQQGCFAGRPYFIPEPNAQGEDRGAILSMVLDTHAKNSFLLILDAMTFNEIARATLPCHIPFGLTGSFYAQN